jgi:hypothetical protein
MEASASQEATTKAMTRGRRAIVLVLLSLLPAQFGCSQGRSQPAQPAATPPPPATKMEAFKPTAGSVVTFGYDELGRVVGVSVDVREIRDSKGASVRGLQVAVTESEYRKEQSFVDADEIPELLKGFDALLEIQVNPTQFKNFEVRYKTRGELELTAFNDSRGAVRYSVKAGRTIGASSFLSADNMRQLRSLFSSASQKLATLGERK